MKLFWLNTSETHKQYQVYKIWTMWINARHKRERESLEIVDQSQTSRYVSRFEPLSTSPPSHRRIFTIRPHMTSYTGNLHWGFGKNKLGVHKSSLQQNKLYTRGWHNNNHLYTKRDRHKAKTPTITSIFRGIPTNSNSSTITSTQEGYNKPKLLHNLLHTKRDNHKLKAKRLQYLVVSTNHKLIFPQK